MRCVYLLALALCGCTDIGTGVVVKVAAEVIKSWTDDGGVTRTTPAAVETPQPSDWGGRCPGYDPGHQDRRHCSFIWTGKVCAQCCRSCSGCWTGEDGKEHCEM